MDITQLSRQTIWLDKKTALLAYGLLRQAERSIDHMIGSRDWDGLRSFYGEAQRHGQVQALITFFHGLLVATSGSGSHANREQIQKRVYGWCRGFNKLTARLRFPISGRFGFKSDEIDFMASRLKSLLMLLKNAEKPPDDVLRTLRVDCLDAQRLITMRCGGMSELEKAERVENFLMPDHIFQHYTIDEVVGALNNQPATKYKSA